MRHLLIYKYVEEIVKAGSIRKAAEELSITPSALNRRLLALEEELEVAIFERLPAGVRLNTAGEIFLEHIRHQLSDMERVKSQIADLSGQRRGNITIAASPEALRDFLSEQIASYQNAFPGVSFEVNQFMRGEVEQSLIDHEADIGLVFEPLKLVEFQTVYSAPQQVMAVMSKDNDKATREKLRLYECLEHPLILPDTTWGMRNLIDQAAVRLGLKIVPSIQSNASQFLNEYTPSKEQIRFELEMNVRQDLTAHGQVAIPLHLQDVPEGFLFMGHLKGRTLSVAAARFLEQLSTALANKIEG